MYTIDFLNYLSSFGQFCLSFFPLIPQKTKHSKLPPLPYTALSLMTRLYTTAINQLNYLFIIFLIVLSGLFPPWSTKTNHSKLSPLPFSVLSLAGKLSRTVGITKTRLPLQDCILLPDIDLINYLSSFGQYWQDFSPWSKKNNHSKFSRTVGIPKTRAT